jgi:hypothetical protein
MLVGKSIAQTKLLAVINGRINVTLSVIRWPFAPYDSTADRSISQQAMRMYGIMSDSD